MAVKPLEPTPTKPARAMPSGLVEIVTEIPDEPSKSPRWFISGSEIETELAVLSVTYAR